ncbi:tellurite resistance protein TerB [Albidovulum inexpectatum]|uniref:Tellurite resistance protein TerB n=1 Tax=Albidovulum inexpectatum TaxID=196587 RepID=A0A2S5JE04_9RHOB|nr:tellurite resistance TerB family protein [Albidovulum inexpectatum]PPB79525.1 tellurite resistance protein TerB [Albidovulum inexpectatum]
MTHTLASFSPQDALVAIMVTVSISDETIRTSELVAIERQVNHLPIFADYDMDSVREVAATVYRLMEDEDGLDTLFAMVRDALPEPLWETAYAVACDIAAADGAVRQAELRLLEEIRHELQIDRLHAAAIEWGARVRHLTLDAVQDA